MAQLAETLVQEWLHLQGFFTIRGLKAGLTEADILAVRLRAGKPPEARHVEVQVSFRPISHVAPYTKDLAKKYGKSRNAAGVRLPADQAVCVEAWVEKKFKNPKMDALRKKLCPGAEWKNQLVYGAMKFDYELELLKRHVEAISFESVLEDAKKSVGKGYATAAGGDLAEIIRSLEK